MIENGNSRTLHEPIVHVEHEKENEKEKKLTKLSKRIEKLIICHVLGDK